MVEGLAQYYTDRVVRRLSRRFPGTLGACEAMLPHQPKIYRAHAPWRNDFTPEAARLAMLEMRRANGTTLEDFERRQASAQAQLEPGPLALPVSADVR